MIRFCALLLFSLLSTVAAAQHLITPTPLDFNDPRLPRMNPSAQCPEPGDLANNTCLQGGRFEIEMHWAGGRPTQAAFSESTLLAYWRDPDNLEVLAKVLDGCAINGHFWVFFAAVTDQPFDVDVRDYQARTRMRWVHHGGPTTTVNHTRAFPCE